MTIACIFFALLWQERSEGKDFQVGIAASNQA